MIRHYTVFVLVCLLCGFGDLSLAMAQTAPAESQEASAPKPSPQEDSAPAKAAGTSSETAPANSDPSEKPAVENLPPAPSASQALPASNASQPQGPVVETPSGTAGATIGNPKGNLGSKPAGAAIAPNPQHRSRSWLIKTGLAVGAVAALGSVLALSQSSPSRPPGAH